MHKHTFTKFEFILFCCKFTIIEIDRKFIKTYIVHCRNLSFARKCTIIKTEPFASWLCQTGLFFSLATIHKPSRLCAVTAAATCCNQVQHQTCTQTPVSEKSLSLFLSSYRMFQKFCNFSAAVKCHSIVSAAVKYLSNVSAVPNNCLSSVTAMSQ